MKKLVYPLFCTVFFLLTGCDDVYEENETPAHRHSRRHHNQPRPEPEPVDPHHHEDHHHHHH